MLTLEQKQALVAEIRSNPGKMNQVSPEEIAVFPTEITALTVHSPLGDTPVYAIASTKKREGCPLVLNFHGGGFIGKRMDRDELFCRKIACRFDALVLDVDYKLAPEYPYPTATEECWEVAKWAYQNAASLGADPEKMVLVGHSSGGNLVAGICMRAGQTGLFKPSCAVIDYAPMDLKTDPAEKKQSICDMPAERAKGYNAKYITPQQATEPYASPLFAQPELLEKFPPTLVISAGEDRLCEENELFALKLAQSGVEVTCRRFTDSVHGFVINRMCQWQEATKLIFDFIGHKLQK